MKNTIFINIFSTILALGITIPLGIFCAVHKGKKVDNTVQVRRCWVTACRFTSSR